MLPQPVSAKIRPGKPPAITFSDGSHGMAPADFATIYNSNPLLTTVNGAGVTIAVIGRSDLFSSNQDVTQFRTNFNLVGGSLDVIENGPDPGDLGGGDEAEATLDTSWAGAVAPGSTVDFVVSATTDTTDGIDLSEVYIVENNLANIMTESFSACEAEGTSTESQGYEELAEQAAAQGITYFVSTGDDGAEGCDDQDTETVATGPVSVNILASTAYNVAVGGTVFNDTADPSKYWSATNTNQESALSYIPEDVWNDSCEGAGCTNGNTPNIAAGSGGASTYISRPSWQTDPIGTFDPNNMRDLPDVALNADPHDGYVLCLEGSCVPNSSGEFSLYLVGGTSASTPSFAGIMALIDQQMTTGATPFRQGLANYLLYKLAAGENSTLAKCNASNTTTLPVSTCTFNDVTVGNNAVPGELNYGLSTAQYQAGAGYDMASGLGSVNIATLASNWKSAAFTASTTALTLTPATIVHGQPVTVGVTVTPTTPAPTGDVALIAAVGPNTPNQTALGEFTLASGTITGQTLSDLPGGTSYNVFANYTGDATYGGSVSNTIAVTVTPEPSTTTLLVESVNSNGTAFIPFTGGQFGSFVYLKAIVTGNSGHGTPTGSVNFTDSLGTIPGGTSTGLSLPLNFGESFLNGSGSFQNGSSDTATPNGIYTFDTGTHTISAKYSGDASFNSDTIIPTSTFTITPGFFATTGNVTPTVTISAPGGSGTTSVSVSYSTGFTGTIALACSSTGMPAGTACKFSPASIAASGKVTTTSSNITVTTTAAAAAALRPPRNSPFGRWLAFAGFTLFSIVLAGTPRSRRAHLLLLGVMGLMILVPACGGGGSSSTPPPPPPPVITPTPAGSYSITVTATSGSTIFETGFNLVVQ